jgi:hypothetical protein
VSANPSTSFSAPQAILDWFKGYSEWRRWPFDDEVFERLKLSMEPTYVSRHDAVLTLDVWLGELPLTFEELVGWITQATRNTYRSLWRHPSMSSTPNALRLLDSSRYTERPSAKWVHVDMLANRQSGGMSGAAPRDIRVPGQSAGLQVLTAAAVHPHVYLQQDMPEDFPDAVWMLGLEHGTEMNGWAFSPMFHWPGNADLVLNGAPLEYAPSWNSGMAEVRDLA